MWLEKILNQHRELESPADFWLWSALTAISAVVKDKVYIDKYLYKVYPSIFVLLHADSGLKKGPPIAMARQLVEAVGSTKIFSGRFSIQGMLKELGKAETLPGGKISHSSAGFICLSELTSSIVSDPFAFDILTDLFDRHWRGEKWDSILKQERFNLVRPIVTFIAGTNEAHSETFFSRKEISGGFLARTYLVHADTPNRFNSLMFPLEEEINYKEAAEYLKELAKLDGPFQIAHEERVYFNDWYQDFCENIRKKSDDKTGALNRFDDSVWRVAMLLSLGESPELVIRRDHIDQAIVTCQKLIGNIRKVTFGKGKHSFASEKALLIQELLNRPGNQISRKLLNEKFWTYASHEDWDMIAASLEVAGIIVIEMIQNQRIYRMPEDKVEKLRAHFEGK